MTTPEPPNDDFDLNFDEWLEQAQERPTETDEAQKDTHPDTESQTTDNHAPRFPRDIRAALSTVPLALAWLFGAYIVPNLTTHPPDATRRLAGLGLMAWVISLGCELSVAYSRHLSYPPLGMWEWCRRVNLAKISDRGRGAFDNATSNGCLFTVVSALAVPLLFGLFYVFTTLLVIAIPLWVATIGATVATHVTVTIVRHRKGSNS